MTEAGDIVLAAFRDGNLVPLNATTGIAVVTDGQKAEGLSLLNEYLESLFGFELGELSMDWPTPPRTQSPVAARYPIQPQGIELPADVWPYPPANVRIIMDLLSDTTIFMPQAPDNGARFEFINIGDPSTFSLTISGNTRLVEGAASITATPGDLDGRRLFYRSDKANWTLFQALTETTESPLPLKYNTLLSIGTFQRLAPRFGRSMSPENIDAKKVLMRKLKAEYRQKVPIPIAKPNPFTVPASDSGRGLFSSRGVLF